MSKAKKVKTLESVLKVEERRERRRAWLPGGRGRFFWAAVQKSANFLFAVQNAVVKKWGKF